MFCSFAMHSISSGEPVGFSQELVSTPHALANSFLDLQEGIRPQRPYASRILEDFRLEMFATPKK
jgi:hypothetical protein